MKTGPSPVIRSLFKVDAERPVYRAALGVSNAWSGVAGKEADKAATLVLVTIFPRGTTAILLLVEEIQPQPRGVIAVTD